MRKAIRKKENEMNAVIEAESTRALEAAPELEHGEAGNETANLPAQVSQGNEPARLATVKGLTRDRIEEMRNQLGLLQEFVAKVMIRGEHYGVIPGTSKPTLLKAGAEFLREAYGFEVRSTCVDKKFIPGNETENGREYIEFTYRVELMQNGLTVGVCEGSCNNYERRYQSLSPYAVLNTIQKMAQKRAYVGAVISATRSSNIFTQDLEDEPELATGPQSGRSSGSRGSKAPSVQPQNQGSAGDGAAASSSASLRMATPGQAKLVWARLKNELQLNDFAAREFISKTVNKTHSRDLTSADIEKLLAAIDAEAATGSADSAKGDDSEARAG